MKFDVIVIGSGPGGYVAAIRCAQLGKKTALVERYPTLGGTCLNVGCIPTKALLESSQRYYDASQGFARHGIEVEGLRLNFATLVARKDGVVGQNGKGIQQLLEKNGVEILSGHAGFIDPHTIRITSQDGETTRIEGEHIIIATGSKPFSLPGIPIDKKRIITSTEALSLKEVPESMIIIGAGVIGLEMGSVYARLGTRIQVLDIADCIIPTMDHGIGRELQRSLKKVGLKFTLGCSVTAVETTGESVTVRATDSKGKEIVLMADYCLTAIGRKPYTEGLHLENAGIATAANGRIPVDDHLQCTPQHIFAIGDVVRGPMLAHKASEEGVFVAETIAGQHPHLNYRTLPSAVYTSPEAAGVGYTEEELLEQGISYTSGSCPIRALGRAHAADKLDGSVKVLANKENGQLLGVHMVAPGASDLIAEAVVAMEAEMTVQTLGNLSHPHPSFSEALKEACLMASEGKAIHVIELKKGRS